MYDNNDSIYNIIDNLIEIEKLPNKKKSILYLNKMMKHIHHRSETYHIIWLLFKIVINFIIDHLIENHNKE